MKFIVECKVEGNLLDEEEFDSTDSNFSCDIGRFCNRAGHAVKDYLTFAIAQKVRETGKSYNEVLASAEIHLQVCFGDLRDRDNFAGCCDVKFTYELKPEAPGIYQENFIRAGREISNIALSKFQSMFGY